MTRLLLPLLLFADLLIPVAAVAQDEGPSQDVAELQVLSNYVGKWDIVAGSKDDPFAKGTTTVKWILDGRFIQGTGTLKTVDGSNDFKVTMLMTYVSDKNVYRRWSFFSYGMTSESEGTWDAETQTMTLVTRYGDIVQTTTSNFAEDGVEEWTMVSTDEADRVVNEMRGTNSRRDD